MYFASSAGAQQARTGVGFWRREQADGLIGNGLTPAAAIERAGQILQRLELLLGAGERGRLRAEFDALYVDTFTGHHSARKNGRKEELPEWKEAQREVRAAARKIGAREPSLEATKRHIDELVQATERAMREKDPKITAEVSVMGTSGTRTETRITPAAFEQLHAEYVMLRAGIKELMPAGQALAVLHDLGVLDQKLGRSVGYYGSC